MLSRAAEPALSTNEQKRNRNPMATLFEDAIATFRARASAGDIRNRKTGRTGPFAQSRIGPILSHVTAAVRRAVRALNGGREIGEAALMRVDLDPLWNVLADHARDGAREDDRSDPAKEAANARLFVSVVSGVDADCKHQPLVVAAVPEPWRPYYEAVEAAQRDGTLKPHTAYVYKWNVKKISEMLVANGIGLPDDLPEWDRFLEMARARGWSKRQADNNLTGYRAAMKLAGAEHMPTARRTGLSNGQGVRSLSDLSARLVAAGYRGDPLACAPLEAVRFLAPNLGISVAKVIREGRAAGMSRSWATMRIDTASWVVATLLRDGLAGDLGIDLRTVTWLDLFTRGRDVPRDSAKEADVRSEQFALYEGEEDEPGKAAPSFGTEYRTVMRYLLDASAKRSYANSPLTLASSEHAVEAVPVYTEKLRENLKAAWMVTTTFFDDSFRAKFRTKWSTAAAAYDALMRYTREFNNPRMLRGRKRTDRLPLNWGELMCVGLPALARRARTRRDELRDHLAHADGTQDSRLGTKLVNRLDAALRDYVLLALLGDDGMRIKQYANASVFNPGLAKRRPELLGQAECIWRRAANGEVVGISALGTHWRGDDHEDVRLKMAKRNDETRVRDRTITPAFLDLELLFAYLTEARPRALVSAGVLAHVSDYCAEDDSFALFVTSRPQAKQTAGFHTARAMYEVDAARCAAGDAHVRPRPSQWRGHYSESMLSRVAGRALHWVCVDALKREYPPYAEAVKSDEWRGLFAAHIFRALVATYWGGHRRDWSRAERLTNDSTKTLVSYYAKVQSSFENVAGAEDSTNPHFFDAVIDRAVTRLPADDWSWHSFWQRFDPRRPSESLERLSRATQGGGPRRLRRGSTVAV